MLYLSNPHHSAVEESPTIVASSRGLLDTYHVSNNDADTMITDDDMYLMRVSVNNPALEPHRLCEYVSFKATSHIAGREHTV